MAKKTNVSSTFRITAIVGAVMLLAAATISFLQGGSGGSPTALLRRMFRMLSSLSNVLTLKTSGTSVIAGIL